MELLPYI
jgi:hypothetical protein